MSEISHEEDLMEQIEILLDEIYHDDLDSTSNIYRLKAIVRFLKKQKA
jgi:hypothetical protein